MAGKSTLFNGLNSMMYYGGWAVYLFAALVLAVYWWRLTGGLGQGLLRGWLRWLVAAVLFTPAASLQGQQELAPAFIVIIFGSIIDGWEAAQPGARALGVAVGLGFAVVAATSLVNKIQAGKAS